MKNGQNFEEIVINKKPIQKVIPSRNASSHQSLSQQSNSSNVESDFKLFKNENNKEECLKYAKPKSPTKCNGVVSVKNVMNLSNSHMTNSSVCNEMTNMKSSSTFKSHYR